MKQVTLEVLFVMKDNGKVPIFIDKLIRKFSPGYQSKLMIIGKKPQQQSTPLFPGEITYVDPGFVLGINIEYWSTRKGYLITNGLNEFEKVWIKDWRKRNKLQDNFEMIKL